MQRLALLISLMFTAASSVAADAPDATAAGVWKTASGGYVQFHKAEKGDNWIGTIVGSTNGKARYDDKNPDKSERGRRLLGVTVIKDMHKKDDGEFGGGTIYDPENGKTYSAKVSLKDPDTLDVRGYIGISLLGKTQTWHRISPNSPHVRQRLLVGNAGSDKPGKSDEEKR